ncbi:MAG: Flp pilus assembly protein CpaB [Clostridia bacterium]|nr:Flp pilus assembly protein CpaB [Clostridia bacterium]
MKNRTVIGVICMILAIVVTFAVAPIVNRLTSDTTDVVRLGVDMKQGVKIEPEHLEVVTVKTDSIPAGVVLDPDEILGKYSATALYAGDYLTEAKLAGEPNTASDALASLNGTKVAVSVTIDTFAAGLSGKLENGDIVSIIVTDEDGGSSKIPGALKYMKVITTTTAGGIDQDSIVKNEDGSYEIPSTVTLLCNIEQAKLLAKYENNADLTVALVYRGTPENAKKFLDMQDEYFLTIKEEEEEKDDTEETDNEGGGDDIVQHANDIINGNADYYDVNDEVDGNG